MEGEFLCTRRAARFLDVTIAEYACLSCGGAAHREGDPLFKRHVVFQAKHTFRQVDVYQAILEAHAGAAKPEPENPSHG
jgi:hypothetical protein